MDVYRSISRFVQNHPTAWNLLHPPYILAQNELKRWRTQRNYRGRLDGSPEEENRLIKALLIDAAPCAIGKIGSVEAQGLDCYLRFGAGAAKYPPILMEQLFTLCGIFPSTSKVLDEFCASYLTSVEALDLLAVWGNPGEDTAIARHGKAATLIHRTALEPYHYDEPWSSALAAKTVLVVHPFAATIERQMRLHRAKIWPDRPVLPEFTLKAIRMPHSPALQEGQYDFQTWFLLKDHLFEQISRQSFDVALIGAGAMSLPLAAFVKSLGKIGIHTGGPTQILFGIIGRRWEETREHRELQSRFNAFWTRPSDSETPASFKKVEQGGYW